MTKRRDSVTFNDIVTAARREADERVTPRRERGLYADDFGEMELVDDAGRVYHQDAPHLTPTEAQDLAVAGAGIVWDPCGCGGGCGMIWLSTEEVNTATRTGPPKIVRKPPRHIGSISKWTSQDGSVYLLAEEKVVWADKLA